MNIYQKGKSQNIAHYWLNGRNQKKSYSHSLIEQSYCERLKTLVLQTFDKSLTVNISLIHFNKHHGKKVRRSKTFTIYSGQDAFEHTA